MDIRIMEILPAWMIEELEKLRKEQERKRPELRIEIPLPIPRCHYVEPFEKDLDLEDSITFPLL
jgi:benzoyl-CoA reductase/2-hydroxyglutaryl-CoA dehydratase subunit BcrC/BadD/HgdB